MHNRILYLILVLGFVSCNPVTGTKKLNPEKDKYYPQWLSAGDYHTDQTSGIAYLNTDKNGYKNFLLADDIGKIHHLVLSDTGVVSIRPVNLSDEVKNYFSVFPKEDFEDIIYDKYTNSVYLSVEGNLPSPADFTGIFRLNFAGNNVFSDSIISVTKLDIKPVSLFRKYLSANIAYEGITADENYLYLGLEGFQEGKLFADSTIIFVVNKKSLNIVKEINTKKYGIHTICGLYSDKNSSLYGIDRNNKKIFHLLLNDEIEITNADTVSISTGIPGYSTIPYVASLESITLDEDGNIYMVDDPWKTFFIPPDDVLGRLDTNTVANFKKYIPVIFKFNQIK
jgi:hypothetical protein